MVNAAFVRLVEKLMSSSEICLFLVATDVRKVSQINAIKEIAMS